MFLEPPPTARRPGLSRDQRQPPFKPRGPAHSPSPPQRPAPRVLRRERPAPPPPRLPARSPLLLHASPRNGHASLYQRPASSAPAPPTPCLPYTRFRSHKASASAIGGFASGSRVAIQREAGEVAGELVRAVRVRKRVRTWWAGEGWGGLGWPGLGSPPEHCSTGTWWPGRPAPLRAVWMN